MVIFGKKRRKLDYADLVKLAVSYIESLPGEVDLIKTLDRIRLPYPPPLVGFLRYLRSLENIEFDEEEAKKALTEAIRQIRRR